MLLVSIRDQSMCWEPSEIQFANGNIPIKEFTFQKLIDVINEHCPLETLIDRELTILNALSNDFYQLHEDILPPIGVKISVKFSSDQ